MLQQDFKFKKYKIYNYQLKHDFSKYRLTVDTKTDFNLIKKLFKEFDYNFQVSLRSIIKYFINNRKFAKQFISLERIKENNEFRSKILEKS